MRLQLYNFRCFQNLDLHFPQNGTVILWGNSGIGKTSIFKAINFVLYGKEQKVTKFGEKKCKVKLDIDINQNTSLTITRTKNPTHLTLKKTEYCVSETVDELRPIEAETFLEDDSAQSAIEQYFGKDFLLTSYMSQKGIENFFTLSSNEKAIFLQKLALKEFDVDQIRKKIKEILRMRKDALISVQTKKDIYKLDLDKLLDGEDRREPTLKLDMKGKTFDDFIKHEEKIRSKNKLLLSTLKHSYMKLTTNLNEVQEKNKRLDIIHSIIHEKQSQIERNSTHLDSFGTVEQLSKQINQDKELLKYLEAMLKFKTIEETYTHKLEEYEELDQSEKERLQKETKKIQDEISKLDSVFILDGDIKQMKQNLDITKQVYNFVKEFDEECDSKNGNSLKMYLEEYLVDLQEGFEDNVKVELKCVENLRKANEDYINIQNRIKEIMDNISNIKKASGCYKCPSCSQPFYIDTSIKKVIKLDDDPNQMSENLKILEENLKKCNQELIVKKQEIHKIESKKKEISLEILNIQQTIDQSKHYISQLSSVKDDRDFQKIEIDINENMKNKTCLDMLQSQLKKLTNVGQTTSQRDMWNRVQTLKQQLEQCKKELHQFHQIDSSNLKTVEDIKNELIRLREKITISTQTIKTAIETKKTLDSIQDEINALQLEMNGLQKDESLSSKDTEEIKKEIEQVKKDLEQAEDKDEKFKKREEKIKKYIKDLDLYKKIDEKMSLIAQLSQEEALVIRGISKAETFLRKVNDAEAISLQNTIDNINIDVEEYIQNFFGENVTVKLASFKETNKGKEIKPGISVIIMKDGEQVDIDSLSGGEYDRLALAFFLAFNKVSKSNIIMLDESLSSIHAEMVEDIVMFVKEKLKDKLVLFTLHQCNTGLFDKMIDVENIQK